MIPEVWNLPDAYRGDTYDEINFQLIDYMDRCVDLTGASARIEFRKKGEVIKCYDTFDSSLTIPDPLNGIVAFPAQIIDLPGDRYSYDLQITYADNRVETFLRGSITIQEDVTKPRVP